MKENKPKSGHELMTLLTEEERINFIEEVVKTRESLIEFLDSNFICFHHFIGSAFIFLTTSQGFDYWEEIRDSNRDGVDYNPLDFHEETIAKLLAEVIKDMSKNRHKDDLDEVLSELKIKKTKSVMTKLIIDINPYLRTISFSAKINGVEEREELKYDSLDDDLSIYFASLGEEIFRAEISYTDYLHVEVFDEENVAVPFKLKTSK
jgi:hypothetical protein